MPRRIRTRTGPATGVEKTDCAIVRARVHQAIHVVRTPSRIRSARRKNLTACSHCIVNMTIPVRAMRMATARIASHHRTPMPLRHGWLALPPTQARSPGTLLPSFKITRFSPHPERNIPPILLSGWGRIARRRVEWHRLGARRMTNAAIRLGNLKFERSKTESHDRSLRILKPRAMVHHRADHPCSDRREVPAPVFRPSGVL